MKLIRQLTNNKFASLYGYYLNSPDIENHQKKYQEKHFPNTPIAPFSTILKETHMFIIHNNLVDLFVKELQSYKGNAPYKLNPKTDMDNIKQPIIRLPFKKIWVELSEPLISKTIPKFNFELLAFLIEFEGEDLEKDWIYFTLFFTQNTSNKIEKDKRGIILFPLRIHKYERQICDGVEIPLMDTSSKFICDMAESLGLTYSQYDIAELENITYFSGSGVTSNNLIALKIFVGNVFVLFTWILQYIHSANSEIVYIGNSKEDYENKLKRGRTPVPPAHTIILRNKLIRTGYLFNGYKFSKDYSFSVRGHYRTLKHERYTIARWKTVWINPFRKGKGEYVKKNYVITRQDLTKI